MFDLLSICCRYRKSSGPEKAPIIGVNLEVRKTGFINIGDSVYIARKDKNE